MDIIGIYCIKTDIVKEDKTKLQINVIGENLADAISSVSCLKYNGEELAEHIISAEKFVDKVYLYTYSGNNELNPNYKPEKNNEDK